MEKDDSIKISIIIPVHNAETTLKKCVDSIMEQKYGNIECILVENGSLDRSRKICLEYASKYNNIIAVSNNEVGVSNARNKGLSLASGDIIGFCDADDFMEKNAIEIIVKTFQENKDIIAIISGFYVGFDNENEIIKKPLSLRSRKIYTQEAVSLILVNDSVMGSVWNKFYKAEVIKNHYFDVNLTFCEDMHFNVNVLSSVSQDRCVKIINNPLYCYMDNPQSITHKEEILFNQANELEYIVALKSIIRDCNLSRRIISLIKMRIVCFSIDTIWKLELDNEKKEKLVKELKRNYIHLFLNMWENSWKSNLKRICKGAIIILRSILK